MAAQQHTNTNANAKSSSANAASKDNAVLKVLNGKAFFASACSIM